MRLLTVLTLLSLTTSMAWSAPSIQESFDLLKARPPKTAAEFYNLGTLALSLQKPGEALAYLERAKALDPFDADTAQNLKIARDQTALALGSALKLDPASHWSESLADRVSLEEIRGVLGAIGLLTVFFWFRSYRKHRRFLRVFWEAPGLLGLSAAILTLGLYICDRRAEAYPPAIALERVTLRSGPGDGYLAMGTLEPGVRVRIEDQNPNAGWIQVRYGPDQVAWVTTGSLLLFQAR